MQLTSERYYCKWRLILTVEPMTEYDGKHTRIRFVCTQTCNRCSIRTHVRATFVLYHTKWAVLCAGALAGWMTELRNGFNDFFFFILHFSCHSADGAENAENIWRKETWINCRFQRNEVRSIADKTIWKSLWYEMFMKYIWVEKTMCLLVWVDGELGIVVSDGRKSV